MKNFILSLLFLLSINIVDNSMLHSSTTMVENQAPVQKYEDFWIEYVIIDGVWWVIEHYPDGSIKAYPLNTTTPD